MRKMTAIYVTGTGQYQRVGLKRIACEDWIKSTKDILDFLDKEGIKDETMFLFEGWAEQVKGEDK